MEESLMDCPLCNVKLQLTDRQGVAIDYCPECRGIWLDRGELEKLIELSSSQRQSVPPPVDSRGDGYRSDHYARRRDESIARRERPRKRESWLSELFDFD